MKKFISIALALSCSASLITVPVQAAENAKETISYNYLYDPAYGYMPNTVHTREMEKLNRGLVAVKSGSKVFLSWRLMSNEDTRYGSAEQNVSFNVYRDGEKIATVSDRTNYVDSKSGSTYQVAPVIGDVEGDKCEAVTAWNNSYIDIPLTKPADETIYDPSGTELYTRSFSPSDCSTGDLDGDGEYEIVVKWTSDERDVGEPGDPAYSGTVHLAAYKLDGTKMWNNDVELGKNVYSSAHTVQFLVYDFDGDGKAEVTSQTSLGSKDGEGNYVTKASIDETISAFTDEDNANADYRGYGRITTGEEFLTIFNGETGAAMDTIDLPTPRGGNNGAAYGDDFGNRSNRFLSNVAYLDGEKPYAIYMRGYYGGRNGRQRTSIAGVAFENGRLNPVYRFDTEAGAEGYYDGASAYVANGNHNCTVADVDNDGKDEFITGALCMEVNDENLFRPRWCTGLGHGDALHIGDYDPTHVGFEFFTVHEGGGYGMSVIDADTGEHLLRVTAGSDTGRGLMANMGIGGYYQVGSARTSSYMSNGGTDFEEISTSPGGNFRVFWDGDLYDEQLDGTTVNSWNGSSFERVFSASGCVKINGSKSNPGLQADILGDWREELIYPTQDGSKLRVFTTTTETEYKIKTLMQDPVYRSGVAAQQTAYNQPPHVGIYMGEEMFASEPASIEVIANPTKTIYVPGEELDTTGLKVKVNYEDGTFEEVTNYILSDFDSTKIGKQTITVTFRGKSTTFDVEVKDNIQKLVISSYPQSNIAYEGGDIDTTGLVVEIYFTDGTSSVVTDYTLSGYDTNKLGNQTVTVNYLGKTVTFPIVVKKSDITSLNRTYTTSSTTSSSSRINIGQLTDTFVLEHTLKINSLPASNGRDKNDTSGFFMRFLGEDESDTLHTGGGISLTNCENDTAALMWKSTSRQNITTLTVGETYTLKYTFANVGTGNGTSVNLIVLDSSGNELANVEALAMRNFSDTATGRLAPITMIELFNQAAENSTASVTINNTVIYSEGEIISVDGKDITVIMTSLVNSALYAAKYENGALTKCEILVPSATGTSTVSASFEPDKVFLWSDMYSVDMWKKTE